MVAELKSSFQDGNYLYLLMDYLLGSNFMNLFIEKSTFPEKEAVLYFAEIVLAIEFVHSSNLIHTDIKTDNILIVILAMQKYWLFGEYYYY